RFSRDWSSDVCSSDLRATMKVSLFAVGLVAASIVGVQAGENSRPEEPVRLQGGANASRNTHVPSSMFAQMAMRVARVFPIATGRSEERRVGKGCITGS